jgi:DNA-binding beta-propeller fold protein YncE
VKFWTSPRPAPAHRSGVGAITIAAWCVPTALTLAVLVSAATAGIDFRYVRALDLQRHEDGRLLPAAVTCDEQSGGLVVTDGAHGVLHLFNAGGIEAFRTSGYAGLSQPDDGALDHAGRLVAITLAGGSTRTLVRLDVYGEPDGWTPESPRDGWRPEHVLVARDGNYVTVDDAGGLLAKHDAGTGAVLWAAVIAEPEPGERNLELGLGRPAQLPDGSYAVPGSNLHRILLVDEGGQVRSSFGRFGSSPGRFVAPVAVAAGPDGMLLVLDQMRHKVLAFAANQEFVGEFGTVGDAPGAFYHPVSIATDADGHLYVAQGYRGRVQVFSVLADGAVE